MHSRLVFLAISLVILSPLKASAESVIQTDWSDGPGEISPVLSWQSAFKAETGVDIITPGEVKLGTAIVSLIFNQVSNSFGNAGHPVSADFDGDGDIDIICDDMDLWKFALFENHETDDGPQWQMHELFDMPWIPNRESLPIDLDEDGDIDLVTACGPYITYWENIDGTGLTWEEHTICEHTGACAFGCDDLDQDGDIDIVGCAFGDHTIAAWENLDGIGHDWTEHIISTTWIQPEDLRISDIDGDLDTDFFCAVKGYDLLCWFENLGSWSWEMHSIDTLWCVNVISPGDYDGDGDEDIAAVYAYAKCIYDNLDGIGLEWLRHDLPYTEYYMRPLFSSDIDNDGDLDIFGNLIKTSYPNALCIFENVDALGSQWVYYELYTPENEFSRFTYFDDINDDGYTDFIARGKDMVMWYDVIGPADTAWVESSILDMMGYPQWDSIAWVSDEPLGTDLFFQVRSSNDWKDMGIWSDVIFEPGSLEGIIDSTHRYIQYLACLTTESESVSPVLEEVCLYWSNMGIEGGEEAPEFTVTTVPNPFTGSVSIVIPTAFAEEVELYVYDISGKLVRTISERDGSSFLWDGHDSSNLDSPTGIYIIHGMVGERSASVRLVKL